MVSNLTRIDLSCLLNMSSFRGRLDMVCVRGEQSREMHSLTADECDEMSFCLFKALDFDFVEKWSLEHVFLD